MGITPWRVAAETRLAVGGMGRRREVRAAGAVLDSVVLDTDVLVRAVLDAALVDGLEA
jgi:hypothetical protein